MWGAVISYLQHWLLDFWWWLLDWRALGLSHVYQKGQDMHSSCLVNPMLFSVTSETRTACMAPILLCSGYLAVLLWMQMTQLLPLHYDGLLSQLDLEIWAQYNIWELVLGSPSTQEGQLSAEGSNLVGIRAQLLLWHYWRIKSGPIILHGRHLGIKCREQVPAWLW